MYVVARATTRHGNRFYRVVTKRGHRLGWIKQRALTKGKYVSPITYLTKDSAWTKRVRQLSHSHIEVATLSQAGNLRRVIIQNNDGTAVVINVNGGPNTYYLLRADRTKTAVKEYKNELGHGSLTQTDYFSKTQRLMLTFDTSQDGVSEGGSIEIDSAGVLGQFSLAYIS